MAVQLKQFQLKRQFAEGSTIWLNWIVGGLILGSLLLWLIPLFCLSSEIVSHLWIQGITLGCSVVGSLVSLLIAYKLRGLETGLQSRSRSFESGQGVPHFSSNRQTRRRSAPRFVRHPYRASGEAEWDSQYSFTRRYRAAASADQRSDESVESPRTIRASIRQGIQGLRTTLNRVTQVAKEQDRIPDGKPFEQDMDGLYWTTQPDSPRAGVKPPPFDEPGFRDTEFNFETSPETSPETPPEAAPEIDSETIPVGSADPIPKSAAADQFEDIPLNPAQLEPHDRRVQLLRDRLKAPEYVWLNQLLLTKGIFIWGDQCCGKTQFAGFIALLRLILLGHPVRVADPHAHQNAWPAVFEIYGANYNYEEIDQCLKSHRQHLKFATAPHTSIWDEVTQYEEYCNPRLTHQFFRSVMGGLHQSPTYSILLSQFSPMHTLGEVYNPTQKKQHGQLIEINLYNHRDWLGNLRPAMRGTVTGLPSQYFNLPAQQPITLESWMQPQALFQIFSELRVHGQ
ncbi:MAG: hypothetical protein ACFBSC_17920 [Microcoleaceae cyanobacterium]